jgi:hypothetical protein
VVNGGRLIRSYQLRRTDQVSNRTINLETKVLRMILRSAKLWSQMIIVVCQKTDVAQEGP